MKRLALAIRLMWLAVVVLETAANAETGFAVLNWTQTISTPLTGGMLAKVDLAPCPPGLDTTSGAGYQVRISGGGTAEAVNVTSGNCVPGAPTGTITFTPHFSYDAGARISSASFTRLCCRHSR